MGALGWGGFSLRDHRNGTSPLMRMVEQGARMRPAVTITESTAKGVAPDFDLAGFIRPPSVTLVDGGIYRDCLVSARSAAEYQVSGTAAAEDESPLSIDVAPGGLSDNSVLTALDCGLFIGNLWYLNYSDRNAARMTGMTRFATYWVEDGRIVAPVQVMRFDDSLYHLLGDRLLELTVERQFFLDPETYGARSYRSARLPGLLVEGIDFTL
jgi:predicted Zn-dependent protease